MKSEFEAVLMKLNNFANSGEILIIISHEYGSIRDISDVDSLDVAVYETYFELSSGSRTITIDEDVVESIEEFDTCEAIEFSINMNNDAKMCVMLAKTYV